MTYPTIASLPAAPNRAEPATFSDRADAFVGALAGFVEDVNEAGDYIDGVGAAVETAKQQAQAAAVTAQAEAAAWVSGASYDVGDVVWSSITYFTYRAQTTHSGVTTDPSLDTTNWINISSATLNSLGVTASAAELNKLDGATFTTGANGQTTFADGVNEGFAALTADTNDEVDIDCRSANVFAHTLGANTTFTFSNPPSSGSAYGFVLKVTQDSSPRTITWPASVDWPGGIAPILSIASGAVDIFVFFTHDGGTNWYGFISGQGME